LLVVGPAFRKTKKEKSYAAGRPRTGQASQAQEAGWLHLYSVYNSKIGMKTKHESRIYYVKSKGHVKYH